MPCYKQSICITYTVLLNANDTLFGDRGDTVVKVLCYTLESRWFGTDRNGT